MTSFAAILLSWLLLYKYALLFGVFFLSALALPLPGNTLLLASGAFASQGYMSYSLALMSVMLGNVLGDITGFILADRYGERVAERLRIKRSYLESVEKYVNRHPRTMIVLSRFGGTLDPIVNIIAGLGDISFKTFLVFDVIGNLASLWIVITTGFYLGDYWQSFSGVASIIGWIVFALLAACGILVIFRKQIGLSELTFIKRIKHRMRQFLRRYER
jgi:membrane protein DedA with SNARE-associated domain